MGYKEICIAYCPSELLVFPRGFSKEILWNSKIGRSEKYSPLLPWVPEPQNLNERKREKEERNQLSFLLHFFLFIIFWLWYPG